VKRSRGIRHRNLLLFGAGIAAAFLVARTQFFENSLASLTEWGYLGALIGGALFVFTFSISTGALVLHELSASLHPVGIALVGALGGVAGDSAIFSLIRSRLKRHAGHLPRHKNHVYLRSLSKTRYFRWTLPVMGALIIASPFPDELGVSLMGLSRVSIRTFMMISFIFNALGIFALLFGLSLFL
jgi:uncharacterized membrane protein YdjX (TVP38/TMEM64 family)